MSDPAISCIANPRARDGGTIRVGTGAFAPSVGKSVRRFHRSMPGYEPTSTHALEDLAAELGVARLWVKDESTRFGLEAFKVLGATYALARILAARHAARLDVAPDTVTFGDLTTPAALDAADGLTVVTATDGNHGRALAWAARSFGCNAVVYMPRATAPARFAHVAALGADTSIVDGSYDAAVELARSHAAERGWILVQDSAWEGYEDVPLSIMQGYMTLLDESLEQLHGELPTHVFVQCGVGSLAGAVAAQFHEHLGDVRPTVAVVEPTAAACCYQSMAAHSTEPRALEIEQPTLMAGLACGTPSTLAWHLLRDYADAFVACEDEVAERGMTLLARPHGRDPGMVSGESGAVTAGLVACLLGECDRGAHRDVCDALELDAHSRVWLISTEGATDPETYRAVLGSGV